MPGYVLIVEKDTELQERIGAALRQAGYELAAETEAAWARRSIAVRRPDAVVLGTRLGDGDGFALAAELRHEPDTRATPIVFIATSHRGAAHRAEARRRFAPAEYLATPLDVSAVAPRLADLERRPRTPRRWMTARPCRSPRASLHDPVQQRERRDVERSAKSLVEDPAQAAFAGTLKRTPLAKLLQQLYATRATGSLLLLRDPTKKIVLLAEGYPVSARSNLLGECLGQILLERKLITPEALAASVTAMQKEKRQQGQILIEMGALSPYNLQRALVEQAEAKLLEILRLARRQVRCVQGGRPGPPPGATRLERPPAALILEGIRRHYGQERQASVLERYAADRYIGLSDNPMLRLQEMTADPTEQAFIRGLDGTRQLEKILGAGDHHGPQGAAVAGRALRGGDDRATRRRPRAAASPRRTAAPAPDAPRRGKRQPPLGSGELSMMLQMARTQDHFWALGVGQGRRSAEIDRAYEALARSFHADRYRLASEEDRKAAQEIFDSLAESHRVTRDPGAAARAYLAKLGRGRRDPRSPRDLPAAPGADHPAGARWPPDRHPTGPRAHCTKSGWKHLRARRHHEAVEALRQAARLVPGEADYRAALRLGAIPAGPC